MAPPTSMPANGGQLVFEPSETLVFDLTTDKTAPSILTARNAADVPVAFKVQTTAPKRYLVKPNNGVLEAGASVKLQIHLQPKGRLHVLEKNGGVNDRFMIKCQACPSSFLGLEKGSTQYDEELNRFLESLPTGSSTLFTAEFKLPSDDDEEEDKPAAVTEEVVEKAADVVKDTVAAVKEVVEEAVSEPEVKAETVAPAAVKQEAGAAKTEASKKVEATADKVASAVSPAPVAEAEKEKAYSRTEALLSTISDTAASVLVTSYFVGLKGFSVARSVGDRVGVNSRLVAVDEAYHVTDLVKTTATAVVDKAYEINHKTKPIQEKAMSWRIVSFYANVAGSLINFGKHTIETAMAKVDATASGTTTAEE